MARPRSPLGLALVVALVTACSSGGDQTKGVRDGSGLPRDGVDLFLAANEDDDGAEQEGLRGAHWESPDIKVDAPPYQRAPISSEDFDAMVSERFVLGESSRVYVRVRNRGPEPPGPVTIFLYSKAFGTLLPPLPDDFRNVEDGSQGEWRTGATITVDVNDVQPVIVAFDVIARSNQCMVAVVETGADSFSGIAGLGLLADQAIVRSNNVVARNMELASLEGGSFGSEFAVANPAREAGTSTLDVEAPEGWTVSLEGLEMGRRLELQAGEERTVALSVSAPRGSVGNVRVIQRLTLADGTEIAGGVTFSFGR